MTRKFIGAAAAALVMAACASSALAAPVTLTGNYVTAGVNDYGTLGSGGATPPGLRHDPAGTGNFVYGDYITPGTPHQGFGISSSQTGFVSNSNSGGGPFSGGAPTLVSGAYDNMATWTGSYGGLTVTNLYFYNDGDERVNVTTTLTAGDNAFTNLAFVTSVDPDPDIDTGGSFDTNNQRGNSLFGVTDFVGSAGQKTGLTLGILNLSGDLYSHNARIDLGCCSNPDPFTTLAGSANTTEGDYGLSMAWLLGDLGSGSSKVINYAYVMGANIGTVGGTPGAVPEPATWAMMIGGFGAIGATLRRRRQATQLA